MPHKCKWTPDIIAWLESICPAKEHGFNSRREVWKELNRRFGTDITFKGFIVNIPRLKIWLGFANTNEMHSTKHFVKRPVGSFQTKKDYVRIKVAEPNVWKQYHRYIWEQAHPGQSSEGYRFIFLDGNNRNFDPSNIEAVTPREQAIMSQLGCRASDSREVREVKLLQARMKIALIDILGYEKSVKLQRDAKYQLIKDTPEFKQARHDAYMRRMAKLKKDPEKYREYVDKCNSCKKKKTGKTA